MEGAGMTDSLAALLALAEEAKVDREATWQKLENAGLLNRVKVQEYRCAKGCRLALAIRLGDVVLMRTRDYRMRPHTNEARSVPTARAKNTLNGSDHWPGHTFNVGESAGQVDPGEWGQPRWGDRFRADANCKHGLRTIDFVEVLDSVRDTRPGHPNKPCIML
jgi:hypothetical protein